MNLGEQIYKLRTARNLSQGDLADALEVSRQSVSKWENNSAVPELDKLMKMAGIFGITLDELVTGEQQERPPEEKSVSATVERPRGWKIAGGICLGIGLVFGLVCVLLIILMGNNYESDLWAAIALIGVPLVFIGICCLLPARLVLWLCDIILIVFYFAALASGARGWFGVVLGIALAVANMIPLVLLWLHKKKQRR